MAAKPWNHNAKFVICGLNVVLCWRCPVNAGGPSIFHFENMACVFNGDLTIFIDKYLDQSLRPHPGVNKRGSVVLEYFALIHETVVEFIFDVVEVGVSFNLGINDVSCCAEKETCSRQHPQSVKHFLQF
jgi:hypothetical protein